MKAGERYFMAVVDLHAAHDRIRRILEWSDTGSVPSLDMMAACIHDISSAMVKVSRDKLSDPRFKAPPPCCERGCGYTANHHVCQLDECVL